MSDTSDHLKYKWTPDSTTLLVSVWTDKQVQKQLEYAAKPQLIWESVARYMRKKGYNVTGKQCRSRMKQVLVCYREAKRAGTRSSVEQYYDSIEKVLKNKKFDLHNLDGIDTVDSTGNVKSPPKDVKTNKNLQMRFRYQEPAQCLYRTEALSPTWIVNKDDDYPDSPESNETVLAQPFRVFSPVRDAATNTRHKLQSELTGKIKQNIMPNDEFPIKETIRQNICFTDIPLQNAVQNVQNQIIQENMQQNQAILHQNLLQNQIFEQNVLNPACQQNYRNMNHMLFANNGTLSRPQHIALHQNHHYPENLHVQNRYQQNAAVNNQAMPQEPRRVNFGQNFASYPTEGLLSPSYSPDMSPNLNEAFCQSAKPATKHNLNETFEQPTPANNVFNLPNIDTTTLTNNATFNDDTLSIEFLQDSSSPSDNEQPKSKDFSVNTDIVPDAPFRKKKAQKFEQLVLNAINSQNEVMNKMLSTQNDMVNRFLDVDRDRQNRLEHRLDNLLDVVRVTVLNKSQEKDAETPQSSEPFITNLLPPPRPGDHVPPKLDLVPPKPCRVPCTVANSNIQLINQNPVQTRPGMVSPSRKPGAIWSKLGPVSTSPFVKAQQQLGFCPVANMETKSQSSAERRIAKELENGMDLKALIFETRLFIEMEKDIVEKDERAKRESETAQETSSRRKLFSKPEPTAAMVLTMAFLEAERQSQEIFENARIMFEKNRMNRMRKEYLAQRESKREDVRDKVLAGQGESYDRLRQLGLQEQFMDEPSDSSTPAKFNPQIKKRFEEEVAEPRQTIQQLAQLVMNSARWREVARENNPPVAPRKERQSTKPNYNALDSNMKTLNWIQDKYSYEGQGTSAKTLPTKKTRFSYHGPMTGVEPLGFVFDKLNVGESEQKMELDYGKRIGFVDVATLGRKKNDEDLDPLEQLKQLYARRGLMQQQVRDATKNGNILTQDDMIRLYMRDIDRRIVRESDSDNDEEFLDTTATLQPQDRMRRGSLTSGGSKANRPNCVIS